MGIDSIHFIKVAKYASAGICMAFGGIGTAIGQGMIGSKSCESIAKRPESTRAISTQAIFTMMIVESTAVFAFLTSLILMFVVN